MLSLLVSPFSVGPSSCSGGRSTAQARWQRIPHVLVVCASSLASEEEFQVLGGEGGVARESIGRSSPVTFS